MGRLLKNASSKPAEQIGRIDLDNDIFTIAAQGDLVLGLVNGYRVIDANLHENPIEEITSAMASVIGKAYQDTWRKGLRLQCHEGEWDTQGKYPSKEYMKSLLTNLRKEIGSRNITHLKEAPEAIIPSPSIALNLPALHQNLAQYTQQLTRLVINAERMLEKAEEITKVELTQSMWGVGEILEDINDVRAHKDQLIQAYKTIGVNSHTGRKAASRLAMRLGQRGATEDDKKYIRLVLAPDLISSFDGIRKAIPFLVRVLAPLYRLERTFKEQTGNPVTWSIPGSIIEDFKETYTVVLDFLGTIPEIEKSVMEPLEILQNSFVGLKS